jgi:hypothetical protein
MRILGVYLHATGCGEYCEGVTFWPDGFTGFTRFSGLTCKSLSIQSDSTLFFVTHGGSHGGDDGVCDSSLVEFVNLGWRQIEIHW